MKTKINFQNKQGFAVHSGCRAGQLEYLCKLGCNQQRDFRSVLCAVLGWPEEDPCNNSQSLLDACLSGCS